MEKQPNTLKEEIKKFKNQEKKQDLQSNQIGFNNI